MHLPASEFVAPYAKRVQVGKLRANHLWSSSALLGCI